MRSRVSPHRAIGGYRGDDGGYERPCGNGLVFDGSDETDGFLGIAKDSRLASVRPIGQTNLKDACIPLFSAFQSAYLGTHKPLADCSNQLIGTYLCAVL